jgi:hypothetical protein
VAKQEPGGVVIWEACRAGADSAGGAGFLAGWCLSQRGGAPVFPHKAQAWQGLIGGGIPRGGAPVIPRIAGAQQGPKGGGLEGDGSWLGSLVGGWWGSQWSWIRWCG